MNLQFLFAGVFSLFLFLGFMPPAPKDTLPSYLERDLELCKVDSGSFIMGSDKDKETDNQEHRVELSSFSIMKNEVTQRLWQYIMGSNPSDRENCPDCPVENVSWEQVQEFIQKLNEKTKRNYRLPTEAEWEFAARGGNLSKGFVYAGSDQVHDVAWEVLNAKAESHPVRTKLPNELGIYDMSGNVCEWCSDFYDRAYYSQSPLKNPKGPEKPVGSARKVYRGGSWIHFEECPVASRYGTDPSEGSMDLGFRLVM